MILVIAANQNHFIHWCREVGLNPNDRSSVKYISGPDQLRGIIGMKGYEILTLPEWYRDKKPSVIDEFDILVKEHRKHREEAAK